MNGQNYILVVKGTQSGSQQATARFRIDANEEPFIRGLLLALKESCETWDHIDGFAIETLNFGSNSPEVFLNVGHKED